MTTANYNIRLDNELKAQAFAVIENFGLSPAQAIRLFLKQTAETKKMPLTFDYHINQPTITKTLDTTLDTTLELKPNKTTLESIKQMENGEFKTFDSLEAFVSAYEKN